MSTDHRAGRSPIASYTATIGAGLVVAAGWVAPTVSAYWWSTSGWAPRRARTLAAAWAHLLNPEQIPGAGLSGRAFGYTTIALDAIVVVASAVVGAAVGRRRAGRERGLAYGRDLDRFTARSIVAHSNVILGARDRDPTHSGVRVGRERHSRRDVWLSKESTILVLAPPRSGKTSGTVAPAVIDHHGPVVVTGVREDIMVWTHPYRHRRGSPLWLCEPMRTTGTLPDDVREVRWSPVTGCHDMVTARLRAEALFSTLPLPGGNDEFWRTAGQALLAGYLMSGARAGGRIGDVVAWIDRDTDLSPVEVLRQHAAALTSADDEIERASISSIATQLEAAIGQDPRYRAGVTGQAMQAIDPFRLPAIRRMCDIDPTDSFDPTRFLRESGTIWMLGSESHQRQAAGVCTALTAAIIEAARHLARATTGGRLQPPLLLALDEAVNVAPIPRLEQLLSTGGGSGIQSMVVLQSMAAARHAWGKEMGDALLDFANAKIVLGGLSDAQDLQDLSTVLGVRDERVVQASRRGTSGFLEASDFQHSWRQVPVLRPDEIRALDSERHGDALLIVRSAKAILLRQDRIFDRKTPTVRNRDNPSTGPTVGCTVNPMNPATVGARRG